jgi:DNA-binding protein HU-beta
VLDFPAEVTVAGKSDIVKKIAGDVEGLSRRQAAQAYDALVAAVADALRGGDRVHVPGLGTFSVAERATRRGRNPATGEAIAMQPSRSVRFKADRKTRETDALRHFSRTFSQR